MTDIIYAALIYFACISVFAATATALDKLFAKRNMRRISENALILLAFLGGSFSEYITMKCIRHKTLHKKFMIGLPAIMILQTALILALIYFLNN